MLYDLSAISLMDDGMTEKQAIKTVDDYSPRDWKQELEGARPIIVNTIEKALKMQTIKEKMSVVRQKG